MSNTVHITLRLPSDLVEELDRQAEAEMRSRSQVILMRLRGNHESSRVLVSEATGIEQIGAQIRAHMQRRVESPKSNIGRVIAAKVDVEKVVKERSSGHDKSTCRLYGCLMCREEK